MTDFRATYMVNGQEIGRSELSAEDVFQAMDLAQELSLESEWYDSLPDDQRDRLQIVEVRVERID